MAGDINVYVVRRPGRKFFSLRYLCPVTGERFEKSSGEITEKAARKKAGEWELELRAGGGRRLSANWDDFRHAYEASADLSLRDRTFSKITAVFNIIEETMKIDNLRRVTPQWISTFQKRLIDMGRSPATVERRPR